MSKISVVSNLLFLTIFVLSSTSAGPAIVYHTYEPIQVNDDLGEMQVCLDMMKLDQIYNLIRQGRANEIARNAGCGVHCVFEKLGLMTDNNKINVEKMKRDFSSSTTTDLSGMLGTINLRDMETCSEETNTKTFDNNCDMVADVLKCIQLKRYSTMMARY